MEVIDFHNYLGVEIDRKANKKKGIKEFAPFMMDLPNITLYTPNNPMQMMQSVFKSRGKGEPMIIEGMTIEIFTKIRTNLKLNLVADSTSDKLVPANKHAEDEIHFVKFEGFYPTFELSPENLMKGANALSTKEFRDWTIVDFDNFLNGNPHL